MLNDGTFRSRTPNVPPTSRNPFAGRISSTTTFSVYRFSIRCAQLTRNLCDLQLWTIETISQYHQLLVYTPHHFHPEQVRLIPGPTFKANSLPSTHFHFIQEYTKILTLPSISNIAALQDFNQLVVLHDGSLESYNLRILTSVVIGRHSTESFAGSVEKLTPKDTSVIFFRAGKVADRTLGKSLYNSSVREGLGNLFSCVILFFNSRLRCKRFPANDVASPRSRHTAPEFGYSSSTKQCGTSYRLSTIWWCTTFQIRLMYLTHSIV